MCIVKRHTLSTSEEQIGNQIHSFLSIPWSVDCSGIELNARNIDTMLTTWRIKTRESVFTPLWVCLIGTTSLPLSLQMNEERVPTSVTVMHTIMFKLMKWLSNGRQGCMWEHRKSSRWVVFRHPNADEICKVRKKKNKKQTKKVQGTAATLSCYIMTCITWVISLIQDLQGQVLHPILKRMNE